MSLCKGPTANDGTCQIEYGTGVTTSPTLLYNVAGSFTSIPLPTYLGG